MNNGLQVTADAKVEVVLEWVFAIIFGAWLVDVMCQSLLDFSPLNFIRKLCKTEDNDHEI